MTILFVIDSLAPAGSEQSLATMTPFLVERGISVHVGFFGANGGVGDKLTDGGATLHPVGTSAGRVAKVRAVRRLIDAIRPDLVHTTLFEADVAGRVASWIERVPVVSSLVSEPYGPEHVRNPEYKAWKVRAAQLTDILTARLVRRFHAVSASAAATMSRRLLIPRSRIDVVPRGRGPSLLGERTSRRRDTTRAALGLGDEPVILSVGRHVHVKGITTVVSALNEVRRALPDVKLLIAGRPGPATSAIEALIDELRLGDSVQLLGFRSDVHDLMCAADVLAQGSLVEGSPGVILEAMALRLPLVVSDIPAIRELGGEDPSSMMSLFLPSDQASLARACIGALTDIDAASLRAENAMQRFETTYDIQVVAAQMSEFYERAIGLR